MKKTTALRELFFGDKIFVLAGGGCAGHAVIAQAVGYEAFYMGGFHSSWWILGLPDGSITMTELVENAKRISDAVSIPVFCDADEGFGNAINVRRTIQSFIRAGAAGCHIEDQVLPKRCGFFTGKEIVSLEEAVGKYRAAVDAKMELDPDFVIAARCDARTAVGGGLEEVITRAKAYKEAGVDVLYFEGPKSHAEIKTVKAEFGGPVISTLMSTERPLSLEEQQELGLAAGFYPRLMDQAGWIADWEYAADFKKRGVQAENDFMDKNNHHPMYGYGPWTLVGADKIRDLEEKYLPKAALSKYNTEEHHEKSWYSPGAPRK